MKKYLLVILSLILILSFTACGGDSSSSGEESNDVAVEEEATAETETDSKAIAKDLKDKYGLKGGKSVRNDTTNSWTIEAINSGEANDPTVWAYDYTQAYWNEDTKVMWIVNFANNTTTSINTSDGKMLFVTQHDYVEDEEHDAKVLGEGTVLGDWIIYKGDDGNLVVESTEE